ncbi:aldehyde dehydrogenase family protein [Alkalihalobacterium chitinilyticum]|uniref:Aldehyde dehydrogenase n=1 Tax=Alkalihalobacterium chitinilyticum TaxID=2980103 RepID=A0ABT5VDT0_9BACI|nr:aldehyde dehydrogenase family protein [Alkalihalobacterium chitinilyticum]MDE5413614.1 aldehyde dehydrogenase family protein [Alkalihalobacterium chitinilyticum]
MTVNLEVLNFPLFINGQWVPSLTGETFDVKNPATGEVVAKVAKGNEADVNAAVQAAKVAFENEDWAYMKPKDRAQILNTIAHLITQNAEELAYLEVISSGATVRRVSSNDILQMADLFQTMAKFVVEYPFSETLPVPPFPGPAHNFVWREPIGVCAAITPWNMPMLIATWKIAPALATGNTIVIKPASYTPLTTLKLAEIISQVVPPGVINVVTGSGKEVGEPLAIHPDVDKIAFTGSTEVGRNIMSLASQTIKNTTLELGGKSPNILLDDANLELALPGSLFGVFLHSGQLCESGTRLFVPDELHDEVVEGLVALTKKLKLGHPLEETTDVGPVISSQQRDTVLSYIESGLSEGATLVCGGKEVTVAGCEGGHFIEPTIFTNVTNDMKIAQEEIFGPVLSVIRYSDVDDVIKQANDTIYGLAAGVWTEDVNKAYKTARQLRSGVVWINDWHMLRNDAPFGGYKQSGIGREMGKQSLDAYTQLKHVHTSMVSDLKNRPWYQILFSDTNSN